MRLTRADLLRLRRRATFDSRTDAPRHVEPTMAPTRGLTPAISGDGPKRYVHEDARGIAYAIWSDARDRVPVQWVTVEQWRALSL